MSVIPTVVVPLVDKVGLEYRVRTMMDSGSESNWIAEKVLPFIKHVKLGSVKLRVRHFQGFTTKQFNLVQIYVSSGNNEVNRNSLSDINKVWTQINCLVYDNFFHHRLVYGLGEYIKRLKNSGRKYTG